MGRGTQIGFSAGDPAKSSDEADGVGTINLTKNGAAGSANAPADSGVNFNMGVLPRRQLGLFGEGTGGTPAAEAQLEGNPLSRSMNGVKLSDEELRFIDFLVDKAIDAWRS